MELNEVILFLILAALLAILAVSFKVLQLLKELNTGTHLVATEVRGLRLKARTRISNMAVRNGPETEEIQLARLARASRGKTVVFGGDPESAQHADMKRSVDGS